MATKLRVNLANKARLLQEEAKQTHDQASFSDSHGGASLKRRYTPKKQSKCPQPGASELRIDVLPGRLKPRGMHQLSKQVQCDIHQAVHKDKQSYAEVSARFRVTKRLVGAIIKKFKAHSDYLG